MAVLTIRECDRRLLTVHAAYCMYLDNGQLDEADKAYALMDELLETRLHLPQQRTP